MNEGLLNGLRREETHQVVLLYSGGVDCTASGLVLKKHGYEVYPLFIDYGQSASKAERHLGQTVVESLGFKPTHIIETEIMTNLSKSKLLGQKAVSDSDAWVPGRNTLFMIMAGIYAKQIDADGISIGYTLDDNFVFGDNDYFHHKDMEALLSRSFLQPMEVFMPVKSRTKGDIIQFLHDAKFLDQTVSCWNASLKNGNIVSCHLCANCIERDNYVRGLS